MPLPQIDTLMLVCSVSASAGGRPMRVMQAKASARPNRSAGSGLTSLLVSSGRSRIHFFPPSSAASEHHRQNKEQDDQERHAEHGGDFKLVAEREALKPVARVTRHRAERCNAEIKLP